MDFTVEVMLPPRGATDFTQPANPRYRVLAPVDVYIPRKVAAVVGMQNTGYLHVTGFPDNHPAFRQVDREERERRLSGVICEQWREPDTPNTDPNAPPRLRERRTWSCDPSLLPPPVRQALLTDRQAEITWGQFKALARHQVRGATLRDEDIA